MTLDFLGKYPEFLPLITALIIAIIEWFVPYPFFIRLSRLIPHFSEISRKVNGLGNSIFHQKISGILLSLLIIVPILIFDTRELINDKEGFYTSVILLLLLIESRPTRALAKKIYNLEDSNNNQEAKLLLGKHILRVTTRLSPMGIIKATIENLTLKLFSNFFVPLFYFIFFGIEAAILARLIVILSMAFNQKLAYNQFFGRFCGTLSQAIYLIPAICVSSIIMLLPHRQKSKFNFQNLIQFWPAKSSGMVLNCIAYALGIKVGGPRYYLLTLYRYPILGDGREPNNSDIIQAYKLITLSIWISLFVITILKAAFIVI